jgi:hypothetical protein
MVVRRQGSHICYTSQTAVRLSKAIPVTGHGVPYGCETSRLPHFLDNQFTNGGEVSLTRRPALYSLRKIPGMHFF